MDASARRIRVRTHRRRQGALKQLGLFGLLFATRVSALLGENPPPPPAEITSIADLWSLPDCQLDLEIPIRLEVTVLYNDPIWRLVWLHDGASLFCLSRFEKPPPVRSGERVRITTRMQRGSREISLDDAELTEIAERAMPSVRPMGPADLERADDGVARCEMEGLARAENRADPGHLSFQLLVGRNTVSVHVCLSGSAANLVVEDARVKVRGTLVLDETTAGKRNSRWLFVPEESDVEVIERFDSDERFRSSITLIRDLARAPVEGRVRIQGVVTAQRPTKSLTLSDGMSSVEVETWQARPFHPGERVEAVGLPASEGERWLLGDGFCRHLRVETEVAPPSPRPGGLPVLVSAEEVRRLTPEEAELGYPVRLGAAVTFAAPNLGILFVNDSTAGIFVSCNTGRDHVKSGDWVEIEGSTGPGEFAPVLRTLDLVTRGTAGFPSPRIIDLQHALTGVEDSQWVEMRGFVKGVSSENDLVRLSISEPSGELAAYVPQSERLKTIEGAVVTVRGVCATIFNKRRQLTGVEIFVPSEEFVTVEEQAPRDPFSLPLRRIESLAQFNASKHNDTWVRVRGVVTLHVPGSFLCVQDGEDGIFVFAAATVRLVPGDRVEVAGLLSKKGREIILSESQVRKIGAATPVSPLRLEPSDLESEAHDARLVLLAGVITEQSATSTKRRFTIGTDREICQAIQRLDPAGPAPEVIPTGSRVEVQGVYASLPGEPERPKAFRLLLRSSGDIRVLERPSPFTRERALLALGCLGAVAGLVVLWAFSLKRQVRRQTSLIKARLEREATLERRFRDVVENANDPIFTTDLEGNVTSINLAGRNLLGPRPDDSPPLSVKPLLDPDAWEQCQKMLQKKLLQGGGVTCYEVQCTFPDGRSRTIEVSTSLTYDGDRPSGVQCIARDITERRALEAQLFESQRMETVGRLAAGVAHDFNNILTVIVNHAELLLLREATPTVTRKGLEHISGAALRAAGLTRQLLAFSRKQVVRTEPVDLNKLAARMMEMLRRVFGEPITLVLEQDPELGLVDGDPAMIEQVVLNLAFNARDAMPKGGHLSIRTQAVEVGAEETKLQLDARPGWHACLTVEDEGVGIDEATLQRIFEPFFTTKEIGKGTGLGLATVFGIVKQHNGWIEAKSAVGKGSRFKVYFPAGPPLAAVPEEDRPAAATSRGSERILIVEDEPEVREAVRQILESLGYRTLEAANAAEALNLWNRERGAIDLVLTDMVMPGKLSGKDLAERLLGDRPSLKIIYTSGYSVELDGLDLEDGVNFISKPYSPARLGEAVRRCLDASMAKPGP